MSKGAPRDPAVARLRSEGAPLLAKSAGGAGATKMQSDSVTWLASAAFSAALVASPLAIAQPGPPIGGGYTNALAIPVDDPTIKNISGALFKPPGAGPFPAVVYMSGCIGLSYPPEIALEKIVIDHFLAKGVATFIVDPFTPRNEQMGICAEFGNLNDKTDRQLITRGGNDAVAAVKVFKAMSEIDPKRIFLLGYSYGATSLLFATDVKTPETHDTQIAGVIAYYPYCYDNVVPSPPTLVLIGEKDGQASVGKCQAVKGNPNFDVIVYPGASHLFALAMVQPWVVHSVFDEKAALDAQQRTDAFMDAHMR
jgi:dienelactone hydrolase